jgi:hypothetical protein
MKRIIIIGEGQTEQSFCNDVLQPHFNSRNIYIQNPTIKKTGGGIVNWSALKFQIETHLKQDSNAIVTTLIDYYGIHPHHKYPAWEDSWKIIDKDERMEILEKAMLKDIEPTLKHRFIPYIQLHEFECILFSDIKVFDSNFEESEFLDYHYLVDTISKYPNPELINDGNETAPSKRLSKIIKGYFSDNENHKILYGSLLSNEIGIETIREKCPRFHQWILKLESI